MEFVQRKIDESHKMHQPILLGDRAYTLKEVTTLETQGLSSFFPYPNLHTNEYGSVSSRLVCRKLQLVLVEPKTPLPAGISASYIYGGFDLNVAKVGFSVGMEDVSWRNVTFNMPDDTRRVLDPSRLDYQGGLLLPKDVKLCEAAFSFYRPPANQYFRSPNEQFEKELDKGVLVQLRRLQKYTRRFVRGISDDTAGLID